MVRIFVYLIVANVHAARKTAPAKRHRLPKLSVIIPAHNEERCIIRTIESVCQSSYTKNKLEIIVADDGSTDKTAELVRAYIQRHKNHRIRLVSRPNQGKASALNHAMTHHATGELIMVLDADSTVDSLCLANSVRYFQDERVVATASNVTIRDARSLLGLAQKFEYLLSHHMKRTNTALGMEYVIGGVGSTFRRDALEYVSYYDTDTLTEDIDLTLKIVAKNPNKWRVVFAPDAITYTEPVQTYCALVKQRFRWRFGRIQTFYKNRRLFFSSDTRHSKLLTWFLMPTTLLYEVGIIIEPVLLVGLLAVAITTGSLAPLISVMVFYAIIGLNCIWASVHLERKEKVRLSLYTPIIFVFVYILITVEYITAIQSFMRWHHVPRSLRQKHRTWVSPARAQDR